MAARGNQTDTSTEVIHWANYGQFMNILASSPFAYSTWKNCNHCRGFRNNAIHLPTAAPRPQRLLTKRPLPVVAPIATWNGMACTESSPQNWPRRYFFALSVGSGCPSLSHTTLALSSGRAKSNNLRNMARPHGAPYKEPFGIVEEEREEKNAF